ncbi:corticotropin-releasing factor receptor 1-like [Diorhabda carinulata]|uniref:corticotropin-releasing factor receptor 1-like n=1 Tax=Diorhabda carinulata TaxID=1163345 RepID=UPI0025A1A709|nr:corticotropin-releasing factor receptor 1-like [Diorhabda carinulata]
MYWLMRFSLIFCGIIIVNSKQEQQKYCLLRQQYIYQQLWNYFAGYYCYNYTNSARLLKRYEIVSNEIIFNNETIKIPMALVGPNITASFNYKIQQDAEYIKQSFKNDDMFTNYLSCCQEAEDCCNNVMNNENIIYSSTHCPVIWDAWSCFPRTPVNTTAKLPCSSQAYQSPEGVCILESEKKCIWNETTQTVEWVQQTDYTTCAMAPVYTKRYKFHVIFLSICIGFCIPAIIIFLIFEKLRRTIRVILHRNLLIAIVIRNVLTIMSKELIILDALKSSPLSHHRMEENGVGCRILAFLETSAINSIYGCMFLDAFYLHKVIVRAFATETRRAYIYITLAVLTFTFSICWAIAMAVENAENCWMADLQGIQWTVDGFRIAILIINTLMLADIIRVMVMKLKHGSTTKQTKAAFRATVFLIPLFGLHIIVTAKKIVYDDSCTAEDIYDYARYAMEGLQGIIVSIIFCYANNEVRGEVKNSYRKTCIYLNQRYGWNLGGDLLYDKRRATTATFVQEGYQ